jgi:hypothetical protein
MMSKGLTPIEGGDMHAPAVVSFDRVEELRGDLRDLGQQFRQQHLSRPMNLQPILHCFLRPHVTWTPNEDTKLGDDTDSSSSTSLDLVGTAGLVHCIHNPSWTGS